MITYRTIDYINHTDRDEIIRLYREIFHVDFTREYDFWYGADWAGKPVGVIAVDQETSRCVGHFTTLCFQAVIDEKDQIFRMSMGFMTDPEYRGRGIATNLYFEMKKAILEQGEENCFIIGFPNDNSVHMHVSRMEYTEHRRFHFVLLPEQTAGNRKDFTKITLFDVTDSDAGAGYNHLNHSLPYLKKRYADPKYEIYRSESGNLFISTRFRDKFDILYWSDVSNEKELLEFASFLYGKEGVQRVTTWNSAAFLNQYPAEEREYHMCINGLNCTDMHVQKILQPWIFYMGDCELF